MAGLNIGADDYIAKPFSIREVLARVRSVLRRTAQPAAEEKAVAFEGLRMDLTRKVCTIDGEPLALTKKEFEILRCCSPRAARSSRAKRSCGRCGATR